MSISRSRSRSPVTRKSETNGTEDKKEGTEEAGFKVIVISGLTKNVTRGHLEEVFGVYGGVGGVDVPLFKVCTLILFLSSDVRLFGGCAVRAE